MDAVAVGRKIQELRLARGLSLSALAERAGVSKGYVSQLEAGEQGNPSLETLKKVANALEVTLGELLETEAARPIGAPVSSEMEPGLKAFLEGRRRSGRPVEEHIVPILVAAQWRGGGGARSAQDWEGLYHMVRTWAGGTKPP